MIPDTGLFITIPRGTPKLTSELSIPYFFSQVEQLMPKAAADDAVVSPTRNAGMLLRISTDMLTLCRSESYATKAAVDTSVATANAMMSFHIEPSMATSPDHMILTTTRNIT